MSQRLLRVRELMKRELSTLLSRDFDFGGVLVTVNDVDLTPDFRHAFVFVSTLGAKGHEEQIIDKLNGKHGIIQNKIAKRVILKFTPHLEFRHDDSVKRGSGIVSLIDQMEIPDQLEPLSENDVEI